MMKKTMLFVLAALCASAAVHAQKDATGKKGSTVTDSSKKGLRLRVPVTSPNVPKVQQATASRPADGVNAHPAEAVLRRNPATYAKSAMKA